MVLTCITVSLPITVSLFKCHVFSIKRFRTGIKAHNHNQVSDRSGKDWVMWGPFSSAVVSGCSWFFGMQ